MDTLPLEIQFPNVEVNDLTPSMTLSEVEEMHIKRILAYTKGNKNETARILKIGIATLYRKLEEYKL